jgi:hypothetical protein
MGPMELAVATETEKNLPSSGTPALSGSDGESGNATPIEEEKPPRDIHGIKVSTHSD